MSTQPGSGAKPGKWTRDILDRDALIRSVAATVVGAALLLYGFLGGSGPGFLYPGWLMIIGASLIGYALLTLLRLSLIRRRIELSQAQLHQWGPSLERATPAIIDGLDRKMPVARIAARIKEKEGIPEEITLKYLIALGRYADVHADGKSEREDPKVEHSRDEQDDDP